MAVRGQRARTGRALLALCGHRNAEARDLSEVGWADLDRLADQHRLRPFLHGRLARGEITGIPGAVAANWSEAHRANALVMLGQRRALVQAVDTLASRAIGTVALKGAALAWTVWPAPAERAMRDIDLLVPAEDAAAAYAALREEGWDAPGLDDASLAHFVSAETHFPPLFSPDGVMCELHARVWGRPPLPGSPMPRSDEAHLLAHARYSEQLGAAIPSGEDMLAHLVVHAACSHLLNVGPMALVDIDVWCARKAINWEAFWTRADRDGFARPAALLFALVERWRRPGFLAGTRCPRDVSPGVLDEAERLLVQDLEARKDVSAIASLSAGRLGGRLEQHPLDRAEDSATLSGRAGQLAARGWSLARSLFDVDTRRDGLATARVQKWMEG